MVCDDRTRGRGYLNGKQEQCSICHHDTEVYSRVVGYLRPVKQWNSGKQAEFVMRKEFNVSLSGEKGFITSDRHHRIDLDKDHLTKAETDLFYFDMPIDLRPQASTFLAINVVDKATSEPIIARVKVLESTSEGTIQEFLTDEEGQTLVVLPLKKDYAIQVDKKGYTFYSERVELEEVHTLEEPLELTVELWKPEDQQHHIRQPVPHISPLQIS